MQFDLSFKLFIYVFKNLYIYVHANRIIFINIKKIDRIIIITLCKMSSRIAVHVFKKYIVLLWQQIYLVAGLAGSLSTI